LHLCICIRSIDDDPVTGFDGYAEISVGVESFKEYFPMKEWLFIADAHLSERDEGRQALLVDFLERNRGELTGLVILGDLFEFWFGFPGYVDPAYQPICEALYALSRAGVRLIYLEGNHDFSMGAYFEKTLGCEVHPRSCLLQLEGKRIYLSHGDGIDPGDVGYRFYRRLLKNRGVYSLIRLLGPGRTARIKKLLSDREWMHRPTFSRQEGGTTAGETFAKEQCRQGADVVILAHSHIPCQKTFVLDGRTCYYFNVGDWVEHYSFLRFRPERGFSLEYFRSGATSGHPESHVEKTSFCEG
jgi:UDP-2,3-diacylglucosamine hydrolase